MQKFLTPVKSNLVAFLKGAFVHSFVLDTDFPRRDRLHGVTALVGRRGDPRGGRAQGLPEEGSAAGAAAALLLRRPLLARG